MISLLIFSDAHASYLQVAQLLLCIKNVLIPKDIYFTFLWKPQSLQRYQTCQAEFLGNVNKIKYIYHILFKSGVLSVNII